MLPPLCPLDPGKFQSRILWIGCSDSNDAEVDILGLDQSQVLVLRNLGNTVSEDLSCSTMIQYALSLEVCLWIACEDVY
ncbi:hypothetical protein ASPZODRAFT_133846 [Penicilliopsis zonata CBS 506.65]|uniref:Carbonic anhydrase n=1 Tax=Penicilliopsis zonata CBS 506.65 TaxID=1073090 RepID=A0A1L9SDG3_9EURO|nr:hypothetical protein ASPZODRAFT_133846 [Penicilliopsis zonata CBS 506.65]OJJ45221.1 hypothetical protein ASPZODRAFT_133846 [Penicilliopsis zonata CBS 506.65]